MISLPLRTSHVAGDIRDWRNLALEEKSFDVVIALEVIEHVDCLQDLCDLCKKNGLIVLSSPHPKWDWVMELLERWSLTQQRGSDHCNLTDFKVINLNHVLFIRPLVIHQFAIFRNSLDLSGNSVGDVD